MTDFASIPLRQNDQIITASWFNSIRSELVAFETAPSMTSYADDAAYVSAKGAAAAMGDYYYNSTSGLIRSYNGTEWYNIGAATPYSTENIAAAGDISHNKFPSQYRRIQGDSAAVTTSTTPFGSSATNFIDGMQIILVGIHDTNTVTIGRNDAQYGALLNGDIVFYKGTTLTLIYDSTLERFIELGRNE